VAKAWQLEKLGGRYTRKQAKTELIMGFCVATSHGHLDGSHSQSWRIWDLESELTAAQPLLPIGSSFHKALTLAHRPKLRQDPKCNIP